MMNIKAMAMAAALGAAVVAGPAAASEPVTLNAEQMDQVTAGVLAFVLANTKTGFLWAREFNVQTGPSTYTSGPIKFGNWVFVFGVGSE